MTDLGKLIVRLGSTHERDLARNLEKGKPITSGEFYFRSLSSWGRALGHYDTLKDLGDAIKSELKKRPNEEYLVEICEHLSGDDFGYALMKHSSQLSPVVRRNKKGEAVAWAEAPHEYWHIYLKGEAIPLLANSTDALDFVEKLDNLVK